MANARSAELIESARNHADRAEALLGQASTAPGWAVELLGAIRCILDAEGSSTPAVMKSARKAQEGGKHGNQ